MQQGAEFFLDALAFLESIVFAQTFIILGHVLWIVRSVPIKSDKIVRVAKVQKCKSATPCQI